MHTPNIPRKAEAPGPPPPQQDTSFPMALDRSVRRIELPGVYRRVKLSEDEPHGREEENITLFA
ncbi:hypothetical protein ACI01nite_23080 [Acetobacter cibinongensis]|uniref:Uncharacterized protein n=1 Tax=Acetobacter cibinongensis TaxID=146475 RepID=A0A0D6N746_9PROT|nr:hypothetical protein [Acetobacter cibinongensis]GAN61388.1 hypothetical protein Abci_019_002 [Acetobacter cibinongensis]GEL59706.1 hypothetical protein ACI01nite_23080 [Acetobacter cibinongensis]